MNIVTLDFSKITKIREMHQLLKDSFDFPDFYGRNWDAFWDMVNDYIETPVIVKIVGLNKLPYELKEDSEIMLKVFSDLKKSVQMSILVLKIVEPNNLIYKIQFKKYGFYLKTYNNINIIMIYFKTFYL